MLLGRFWRLSEWQGEVLNRNAFEFRNKFVCCYNSDIDTYNEDFPERTEEKSNCQTEQQNRQDLQTCYGMQTPVCTLHYESHTWSGTFPPSPHLSSGCRTEEKRTWGWSASDKIFSNISSETANSFLRWKRLPLTSVVLASNRKNCEIHVEEAA